MDNGWQISTTFWFVFSLLICTAEQKFLIVMNMRTGKIAHVAVRNTSNLLDLYSHWCKEHELVNFIAPSPYIGPGL